MRGIIQRLALLRKSMFGQMALLTFVFLGWGLYVFAVRPTLAATRADQPELAMALTSSELQQAFHAFLDAGRHGTGAHGTPADDPVVRAVIAANPRFRYHLRILDRQYGNAPAARFQALHLDRLSSVLASMPGSGACAQLSRSDAPGAFLDFYMCDKLAYFEYSGLERPALRTPADPEAALAARFWAYYSDFFIAAGGMFLLFALVLLAHMMMIRRIAALARSFDPEQLDHQLPERGLASEFVPLIRAVNVMIGKVDEGQRRNAFFLSAAAHEMRTPLTVLRTRLEMLEDGPAKDKLIGDLRRLISLVNQLLSLMSIGNRREIAGSVRLGACVAAAVREQEAIAAEQDVTIAWEPVAADQEVVGDATLIRSAVGNLIANAVSFSPPGSVVEVAVRGAAITVRDHGPGILHAEPSALFEPFVRAPVSRRGFGLGLAIVKAVATRHGGSVNVANAAGGGAVFTMFFPVDGEEHRAPEAGFLQHSSADGRDHETKSA